MTITNLINSFFDGYRRRASRNKLQGLKRRSLTPTPTMNRWALLDRENACDN